MSEKWEGIFVLLDKIQKLVYHQTVGPEAFHSSFDDD